MRKSILESIGQKYDYQLFTFVAVRQATQLLKAYPKITPSFIA